MLDPLPALIVVLGAPLAVVAFVPASLLWQRLVRRRLAVLSPLYLGRDAARASARRLTSAARATTLALIVATVVALALLFVPADYADPRFPGLAAPLGAIAALLVLLVWPPLGRPRSPAWPVHASRPERAVLGAVLVPVALLVTVTLAAGFVSVPDAPSPRFAAYPRASLLRWTYGADGVPVALEYTPNGVTSPWPGWFYGLPVLTCAVVLVVALLAVLRRVRSWPPVDHPAARQADDATRLLVGAFGASVAAVAAVASLVFVAGMAGPALVSVSLFARSRPPGAVDDAPFGHELPAYALGLMGQYCWLVLGPAALIVGWLAVFSARELRAGAHVARRALRTPHA